MHIWSVLHKGDISGKGNVGGSSVWFSLPSQRWTSQDVFQHCYKWPPLGRRTKTDNIEALVGICKWFERTRTSLAQVGTGGCWCCSQGEEVASAGETSRRGWLGRQRDFWVVAKWFQSGRECFPFRCLRCGGVQTCWVNRRGVASDEAIHETGVVGEDVIC